MLFNYFKLQNYIFYNNSLRYYNNIKSIDFISESAVTFDN